MNFNYAKQHISNPFVEPFFTFEAFEAGESSAARQDTVAIVDEMSHGYGKWQNMECRQMKADLMDLDVDGDGRIPLGRFYGRMDNTKYQFTESIHYLREVGALEEVGSEQRVRIANYLQGPSNCIASSTYYSVCCLSECDQVLNDLEVKLEAPSAEPQQLLRLMNGTEARLGARMEERLEEIGKQNGGQVGSRWLLSLGYGRGARGASRRVIMAPMSHGRCLYTAGSLPNGCISPSPTSVPTLKRLDLLLKRSSERCPGGRGGQGLNSLALDEQEGLCGATKAL